MVWYLYRFHVSTFEKSSKIYLEIQDNKLKFGFPYNRSFFVPRQNMWPNLFVLWWHCNVVTSLLHLLRYLESWILWIQSDNTAAEANQDKLPENQQFYFNNSPLNFSQPNTNGLNHLIRPELDTPNYVRSSNVKLCSHVQFLRYA